MDIPALHSELSSDPKGLGYAAFVTSADAENLASMLNEVGLSGEHVPRAHIDAAQALAFLDIGDFNGLPQGNRDYLLLVASTGQLILNDQLAVSDTNPSGSSALLAALQAMFPEGSATGANLRSLMSRPCSRAEALFGADTHVTTTDVVFALRSDS